MTRIGWRLLAAWLIIAAAELLRGQDVPADRAGLRSPTLMGLPSAPAGTARPPEPGGVPRASPVALPPGAMGWQQIVRAAGIIFTGRVISVGGAASAFGRDAPSTMITFQVEHAMRGTSTGQTLTIHEWAGLWTNGERYRVGERVLLFLYPPSRLGLTSPVGGAAGKFAVDAQGRIAMNAGHLATFAGDPAIGGRMVVPYADFARVVQRAGGER